MTDDNVIMFPTKDSAPADETPAEIPAEAPPVTMPNQDPNVMAQKQMVAMLWAQAENSGRFLNRSVLSPGQPQNPMPMILGTLAVLSRGVAVLLDEHLVALGEERSLRVSIPGGDGGVPS
jgi:hypothetical protein